MTSNKRGLFVSLEGIEGTGKTTASKMLREYLEKLGHEVVVSMEPGGDAIGMEIRKLLLDSDTELDERCELLLFGAQRAQHVEKIIRPAVMRGAVVLCDRFADSSLAYQGYGRGIDVGIIDYINGYATDGFAPDITLLFDIDVEKGLKRQSTADRLGALCNEFYENVRRGYLEIAEKNRDRFVVIDASDDIESVFTICREAIEEKLGI